MLGKRKIAALVGEFIGTGALTLLILSVQRSNIGLGFFIAIAAGLTVILMSFAVGSVSGGYFNPAITLGFWTARKLSTLTTIAYIVFQFAGAYAAFLLFKFLYHQNLTNIGGHYTGRILVAEIVGTFIFSFSFASTVYKGYNRAANSIFAGLSLTIGIIATAGASLGLLNPAVALGVKAWVWTTYILGPVIGAIIGINLYGLLYSDSWGLASVASGTKSISSVLSSSRKSTNKSVAKKRSSKKK